MPAILAKAIGIDPEPDAARRRDVAAVRGEARRHRRGLVAAHPQAVAASTWCSARTNRSPSPPSSPRRLRRARADLERHRPRQRPRHALRRAEVGWARRGAGRRGRRRSRGGRVDQLPAPHGPADPAGPGRGGRADLPVRRAGRRRPARPHPQLPDEHGRDRGRPDRLARHCGR